MSGGIKCHFMNLAMTIWRLPLNLVSFLALNPHQEQRDPRSGGFPAVYARVGMEAVVEKEHLITRFRFRNRSDK